LPLYIVCGEYVLCARLRPSNLDAAKGCVTKLERIVAQIRQPWPQVRTLLGAVDDCCGVAADIASSFRMWRLIQLLLQLWNHILAEGEIVHLS
jgi:hypothetical protein